MSAEKPMSGAVKVMWVPHTETRNGWEIFHDRSTWDLVAVRPIGNRVYGDAIHFDTWQEARDYADATEVPKESATAAVPQGQGRHQEP